MNILLKEKAIRLRGENLGYKTIAKKIGVSWPTVRNWTKHIKVDWYVAYRGAVDNNLKPFELLSSKKIIRERLIKERGHKCEECGLTKWMENEITLETEHIDGNNKNNSRSNLKLLCPNCHSYTLTWRKKKHCLYAGTGIQVRLKNG